MPALFQLLALFVAQLLTLFAAPAADRLPAALAARKAKYRTLDVTVRSTEFTAAGCYPRNDRDAAMPKEDETVETAHRLVIDGDKMRSEGDMRRGGVNQSAYYRPCLMVSAGGPTRMLFPLGVDRADGKPVGSVEPLGYIMQVGGSLQPIMDHYRGTDTLPGRLARTARREKIGRHDCVEYTVPGDTDRTSYWFDPAADFTLVRRSGMYLNGRRRVIDIESATDGPVGWTNTLFDVTGKVVWKLTATVISAKRNEPVPAETFVLAFPPGTRVQDMSGVQDVNGVLCIRTTSYVIAEDGTEVPVKDWPAEDEPVMEPREPIDWTPPAVGCGVLLAMAGWPVWRRIRGRSGPTVRPQRTA